VPALHNSLDNLDESLIVYGSLAPGGRYHYLLADLPGTWEKCIIRGRMGEAGSFKAFRYEENGPEHPAWLVTSKALPQKFPELDAFEGESYRRRVVSARVGRRRVRAQIYEAREFS